MENKTLKFAEYTIAFQEVPNEVSLVFTISNCPFKCEGCHSEYLWNDIGLPLLDNIEMILSIYGNLITCVCFMGGDQNKQELKKAIDIVKKYNLKICLYTGTNYLEEIKDIVDLLDYIKIGRYIKDLGGLDSCNTNQRFYKNIKGDLKDITYLFKKEKSNEF